MRFLLAVAGPEGWGVGATGGLAGLMLAMIYGLFIRNPPWLIRYGELEREAARADRAEALNGRLLSLLHPAAEGQHEAASALELAADVLRRRSS